MKTITNETTQTTVQLTAKRFKAWLLFCHLTAITGLVNLIVLGKAATEHQKGVFMAMILIATVLYVVTKFRIWWNHG